MTGKMRIVPHGWMCCDHCGASLESIGDGLYKHPKTKGGPIFGVQDYRLPIRGESRKADR